MDKTGATKPTFLWRGILILLPLFLLAGVGLYSLRRDRLTAELDARDRCQYVEQIYSANIDGWLVQRMAALSLTQKVGMSIVIDGKGNLFSLDGSKTRARIPGTPVPQVPPELPPAQAAALHEARDAEYAKGDISDAIAAWQKFIALSPPAPYLSRAKYDLGLLLSRRNETAAADKMLAEVQADRKATTEDGLPLWLLAEFQRTPKNSPNRQTLYRHAVDNPSFLTPAILEGGPWQAVWDKEQATRDFYLHVSDELHAHPAEARAFWTKWDQQEWLVLVRPIDGVAPAASMFLLPVEKPLVLQALQDVLSSNSPPQPGYAQLGVEIAGEPVLPVNQNWPLLAKNDADLDISSAGLQTLQAVTLCEYLSRPELLYAQQRARTLWFAVLILGSAVVALAGFVSAYRGFHQQLRLGEMKSNFVSSVSHELRAPIASMRLLAESLQRGKVPDESKRTEYYGFLVQESRRLSSLIENILDFSRIEQGRKKYQFEPTDLDFLVEQTVKLMQPSATERGVELKLQKAESGGNGAVYCDGLAVQQALINLIDNAVKHSPRGGVVMIGLEREAGRFKLWVEDQGSGIPAEEHERIFERFYRRGSELRRETQGIGIGLSIVKHTVEAHGGRVVLRSAPGEGSRFTMDLLDRPAMKD